MRLGESLMSDDYEFTDKDGRKITFDVSLGFVTAYFENKNIGEFTLRIEEQEMFGEIVHADVIDLKEEFRGAGIGSEMLRLAFQEHGMITPPARYYPEKENRNTMTPVGMAFMLSGKRAG
jgi:hypothetical protein